MRIVLLRTSALGDVVHSLPVLEALRAACPDARIAWVVDEAFAPLLAGHPALDLVISLPLRAWRRSKGNPSAAGAVWRALGTLRSFRPEVAVDLMGNHKAGALAWLSGAPRRLGHRHCDRREPSSAVWINEEVPARGEHAVDRALSLLDGLLPGGPPVVSAATRLACTEDPRGLDLLGSCPRPPLLLQPGAGWGNKRYPSESWGAVAGLLVDLGPIRVLSAPGEESLAQAVVAASGGSAEHWHAPSLPMLATLLRGARALLGGDTGPLHLAHALGTPVLGLFGPTNPRRNGPWRLPGSALTVSLPCSFCHRRLAAPKACLLAIPPRLVADRLRTLLASPSTTA